MNRNGPIPGNTVVQLAAQHREPPSSVDRTPVEGGAQAERAVEPATPVRPDPRH
jgi:hypothetical protein